MKIILSTRNLSKITQISTLLNDPSFTLLTLEDAGIIGEVIEDGTTLEENAMKKAVFAHEQCQGKYWVMAEDTGLFITGLNGEPGIKAARWAGEKATTDEITRYTLARMKNLKDRSATFETVAILISPNGKKHMFSGKVSGRLLPTPRTKPQPNMPYSGLFIPDGYHKVWAEMDVEEENAISHRGKAFLKVKKFLKTQKQ